ncbi:MAG: hypothetical protein ACO22C_08550, partial [Ilumatobacteraceae bacterium]
EGKVIGIDAKPRGGDVASPGHEVGKFGAEPAVGVRIHPLLKRLLDELDVVRDRTERAVIEMNNGPIQLPEGTERR